MIKFKMHTNHSSPFHVHVERPTLTVEDVNELIENKLKDLALVAKTGLFSDLNTEWNTEIVLDCGTMDCVLAKLDETILE